MSVNNIRGFNQSKKYDRVIVGFLSKNGISARLATEHEDEIEKWDILANGNKIDTKYPNLRFNKKTRKPEVWFEYTKLCGVATQKVDQVWYFIRDRDKHQFMFARETLVNFLASKYDNGQIVLEESINAKKGIDRSDRICYVSLDELEKISLARGIQEWIQKTKH